MKTREQIEKRIEEVKAEILWNAKKRDEAMNDAAESIAKASKDPERVAQWIDTWLQRPKDYEQQNDMLRVELKMLEWVIEG